CTITAGPTSGSRHVRVAIIALLFGLLTGCGPRPLPDWAVARPGAPGAHGPLRAPPVAERPDRGPPTHPTPAQPEAELLPFTPEWPGAGGGGCATRARHTPAL